MSIISSVWGALKKAGRAIGGGFGQLLGLFGTFFYGLFGSIDFGLGLLGFRPRKKLYLQVVVMREIASASISIQDKVINNIEFSKTIFKQQANVDIIAVDDEFVKYLDYAAPAAALDVGCGGQAWAEDFGEVGDFFRSNIAIMFIKSQIGYGSPITAFVVQTVDGGDSRGCSLGPLTNYITIAMVGLEGPSSSNSSKTLAHEIAHACELNHTSGISNLMTRSSISPTGTQLTHFQKARLRLSRHVTYW